MTAEIGLFCLILAAMLSLIQGGMLWLAVKNRPIADVMTANCARLQLLLVGAAFFTLIMLRLNSDFTVLNVVEHSNLTLPLLYKVTGTWGNHEGSMLLWVLVLALFGALLSFSAHEKRDVISAALSVQGLLCAGMLFFILFTSNPFERLFPPPKDGAALNPLLQDIGLAIHPPSLYVGYVGFSIVFSLACAAMLTRNVGRSFASLTQPWILGAWAFLTFGIGLGSWWAYRELGWGGFWFWDPVENASLLPWLTGVALLHSNLVLKKRGQLAHWVLLLAILTFAMSLIGTFLVRSGVITSVHSFASDPERGFYILCYLVLFVGGALGVYAFSARTIGTQDSPALLSRESGIILNNVLFITACLTVLLGTTYPMLAEWLHGQPLSVGAPYFNLTVLPLLALAVLLCGVFTLAAWGYDSPARLLRQLRYPLLALLVVHCIVLAFASRAAAVAAIGMGLAAWLLIATVQFALARRSSPHVLRGSWGMLAAHLGAAVLAAGITGAGLWRTSYELEMRPGETIERGGMLLHYASEQLIRRSNHAAVRGTLDITTPSGTLYALQPEYRVYDIRDASTSEASINYGVTKDVYGVIGAAAGKDAAKRTSVRLYINPMMQFIWAGCMLIAIGAAIAAFHHLRRRSE